MSTLVTYFSAEVGRTAKVAKDFANSIGADLFEIKPQEPYTKADLAYLNPVSRCNKEKLGRKDVPIEGKIDDIHKYDTVYIGFPIWYATAPNIIKTFCTEYDWNGINIHLFATSGGSGMGRTADKLSKYLKGGTIIDAKKVNSADEMV